MDLSAIVWPGLKIEIWGCFFQSQGIKTGAWGPGRPSKVTMGGLMWDRKLLVRMEFMTGIRVHIGG